MYKGKSFLAIIPARGGSKGIPHKNIIIINDKPLIHYTIEQALNSQYLDKIIVSTDDINIANISKKCGADVPFLRPNELANDNAKTIDVVLHAVNSLAALDKKYDYIVLLQPTQPFRKYWHIDEAIELIVQKNEESLVSVSQVSEHPILMRTIDDDGYVQSLLKINSTVRRQDFPSIFKVNGAIYINKINSNLNENTSLNDNRVAYMMSKEYDLDIDEPIDLEIFKILLSSQFVE